MMASGFASELRNIARGGLSYRHLRHRIFVAAQKSVSEADVGLGDFLRTKLLTLRPKEWAALAFDDKDWRALSVLQRERPEHWTRVYLPLSLDYVLANKESVLRLYEHNLAIGSALFADDPHTMKTVLAAFAPQDEQSLFAFRVQAAQYSFDTDGLVTLLSPKLKTEWLRRRYLYPLIYQASASPTEAGLEDFLSFVVTGEESDSERATLRFLLRDDLIAGESLPFKAYIALMCHPFDACEILLNHIESEFCCAGKLPADLSAALDRLHEEVPSTRSDHLKNLIGGGAVSFVERADSVRLIEAYHFDAISAQRIADVASLKTVNETPGLSRQLAALTRMRARRYPLVDDFELLGVAGRSWWFCEAGRLLNALMTSMYMIPRCETQYELRDLFRLIGFLGGISPYLATSPASGQLGHEKFSRIWNGTSFAQVETETDIRVLSASEYSDRMWIKAVQWSLRDAERRMRLNQWLTTVRSEIRVAPAYLTGIDWSWLEAVIKTSRLRPFIGSPSGLYALLLLKIEDRDRRPGALRTAIEPIVEGKSLDEFVGWLVGEFGEDAVAFVRFLLEADEILWLGLAPNRTAALAARIHALEICIKAFRYTDILTEDLFKKEWETLNSALLLLSVNAGQFEIPWSVFVRDATAKQHDLYTTAHSLEPGENIPSVLALARSTFPYRYRNEKIVTYVYQHRLSPVVALIVAVVEDFLAHPGYGLEMLLSTRFRHDTMRREFAGVLENVAEMHMQSVLPAERREIVEVIEARVLSAVDDWLDSRMHSCRPDKPDALFDVIPSPDDMVALAESLPVSAGASAVIGEIVAWIRSRLEDQLPAARAAFHAEVPIALQQRLQDEKMRLLEERYHRTVAIDRVIAASHSALDRKAQDLVEWFKGDPEETRTPLTFGELKVAADGLFEAYKDRRGYRSTLHSVERMGRSIPSEQVRLIFDLLREIFAAALDHTEPYSARIRITASSRNGLEGLLFSNLTEGPHEREQIVVPGHPYESLDDVIFREGNSGLAKIAALAATIVGQSVEIKATLLSGSFHLFVPLWCSQEP